MPVSAAARMNSATRLARVSEPCDHVAAHCRQQLVAVQPAVGDERVGGVESACGPDAIPTATARLSSTTGEPGDVRERLVERCFIWVSEEAAQERPSPREGSRGRGRAPVAAAGVRGCHHPGSIEAGALCEEVLSP